MSIPRRLFRAATHRLRQAVTEQDLEWLSTRPRRGTTGDARQELEDVPNDNPAEAPPRRAARHPLAQEYALLGLAPGADARAVQQAWRRAVRENHPDRFANDPAAQAAAQERFLQIQRAYERIMAHLQGR